MDADEILKSARRKAMLVLKVRALSKIYEEGSSDSLPTGGGMCIPTIDPPDDGIFPATITGVYQK